MSDARLRALERRWQESGARLDGGAFLRAAEDAGLLTHDQLRLAAELGHEPARAALGQDALDYLDVASWPRVLLQRWGPQAPSRLSLASVRLLLRARELDAVADGLARALLTPLVAWCRCPCAEHLAEVRHTRGAPAVAQGALEQVLAPEVARAVRGALGIALPAAERHWAWDLDAPLCASDALGVAALRAAVEGEVVPWALGRRDPLAEPREELRW